MRLLRLVTLAAAAACGSSTSPGGGGMTPPPPSSSVANVTIQDFSYSPSTITIKAGTVVRWTNYGPAPHTATSNTHVWDSGTIGAPSSGGPYGGGSAAGTYEVTLSTPGTYSYHCTIHPPSMYPGFTGTIIVMP